jgi:hypothetical protein
MPVILGILKLEGMSITVGNGSDSVEFKPEDAEWNCWFSHIL